jgi:predicted HicB family RNase H-like nuclease
MTNQMLLRPPEELKRELKNIAEKRGLTLNSLAIQIFWEWVNKNRR